MNKLILGTAALVGASAMTSQAHAQWNDITSIDGYYVEGGYSHYMFDDPDVDLGAIQARGGIQFNEYFSTEAEVAIGVVDDDVAGADVELNWQAGAFVRGRYPVNEQLSVHARVGYTHAQAEASAAGASAEDDDGGVGYGVGGEWMVRDRHGVRLDYTRHEFDEAVDNISVSYVFKFGGIFN